jgi:hypothetical protein
VDESVGILGVVASEPIAVDGHDLLADEARQLGMRESPMQRVGAHHLDVCGGYAAPFELLQDQRDRGRPHRGIAGNGRIVEGERDTRPRPHQRAKRRGIEGFGERSFYLGPRSPAGSTGSDRPGDTTWVRSGRVAVT